MTDSFVTVAVDGTEFAIDASRVVEVLRIVAVTPTPGAPGWVLGVINLRGRAVPVVDARVWLGRSGAIDLSTPMLIVQHAATVAAVVVDEVLGIESPTGFGSQPVSGGSDVVELGGRLWAILDVDAMIGEATAPATT